jgi:hypothetical protein
MQGTLAWETAGIGGVYAGEKRYAEDAEVMQRRREERGWVDMLA